MTAEEEEGTSGGWQMGEPLQIPRCQPPVSSSLAEGGIVPCEADKEFHARPGTARRTASFPSDPTP